MAHAKVNVFSEDPEKRGEIVDGTLLRFQPGSVQVEVVRRDLTGNEINKMGELAREVDDNARMQTYVAKVSEATRALRGGLNLFADSTSESGIEPSEEELSATVTKKIEAATSVNADTLSAKAAQLKVDFDAMAMEAKGMGVNLINTHTRSTQDGAFAIGAYTSPNPTG